MDIKIDCPLVFRQLFHPIPVFYRDPDDLSDFEPWKGQKDSEDVTFGRNSHDLPMPRPFKKISLSGSREYDRYSLSVFFESMGLVKGISKSLENVFGKLWRGMDDNGAGIIVQTSMGNGGVFYEAAAAIDYEMDKEKKETTYRIKIGGNGLMQRILKGEDEFRKDAGEFEKVLQTFANGAFKIEGNFERTDYRINLCLE